MLTRTALGLCYRLQRSGRYRTVKAWLHDTVNVTHHPRKQQFDRFMITLVLVSLVGILPRNFLLPGLDYVASHLITYIFIVELGIRFWLNNHVHQAIINHYEHQRYLDLPFHLIPTLLATWAGKFRFFLTPLAIIDILAILPLFLPEQEVGFWYVFRLLKFFRYSSSVRLFSEVLANKRLELITLMVLMSFLLLTSSAGFYMFEQPQDGKKIEQLLDAFYWSVVTLATVGYGDITPKTAGGKLVTLALIISGIWVLTFFTSVIVAAFQDRLHELRDRKLIEQIDSLQKFYIICGYGRVGQEVARQLAKNHEPFVIIESDQGLARQAKDQHYLVYAGDASENEILLKAGIKQNVKAVLCTTGNDVINVYITLSCRALNPSVRIIARANHKDTIRKLYQAGADHVVEPYAIAGLLTIEYVGQPVAFEAIMGILNAEQEIQLESLELNEQVLTRYSVLADFEFTRRKVLVLGVITKNLTALKDRPETNYLLPNHHFYFNPGQDFRLNVGDNLVILGRNISLDFYRKLLKNI